MIDNKNKQLVENFCQLLSERKLDEMFELMAPEATWTVAGSPERFPYSGKKDKRAVREMLDGFLLAFDRFRFIVDGLTADDGSVVVEARSEGDGPGARRYDNEYLLKFTVSDGRVGSIREFFDQSAVLDYASQKC